MVLIRSEDRLNGIEGPIKKVPAALPTELSKRCAGPPSLSAVSVLSRGRICRENSLDHYTITPSGSFDVGSQFLERQADPEYAGEGWGTVLIRGAEPRNRSVVG